MQRHHDGMELVAVIVVGQARHLLIGIRRKLHHRFGAETVMLLPAGDERLLEPGADAFAADQPQMAGAVREVEDALRLRRAQPLEIIGQLAAVEGIFAAHRLFRPRSTAKPRHLDIGNRRAVFEVEPAILTPDAFLQRRLAPQRAAALRRQRPAAEMRVIDLAI